ncbi:hypothetical protein C8T65DRAFT_544120, partial [Cerioporus squamosus]
KRRVRFPWRVRKKVKRRTLSKQDKEALKEKREGDREELMNTVWDARDAIWAAADALHERFGKTHTAKYYYQLIVQRSNVRNRAQAKERKISQWNVFVSKEIKKYNEEMKEAGLERKRISDGPIQEIAQRWAAMSQEERDDAVGDGVEELEERRRNRVEGIQNVVIAAFNDTRATLATLQRDMSNLHGRTDIDIFCMAFRSKIDSYNAPYIFYTSERIAAYVQNQTKKTIQEFALGMEAYNLSGANTQALKHDDEVTALKKKVADLVYEKLLEACEGRSVPPKMFYMNFELRMTAKYGIVVRNWPIRKFTAPGNINSLPTLSILYNAWRSGTTHFRRLDDDEWQQW